jgi:hypothetical protein
MSERKIVTIEHLRDALRQVSQNLAPMSQGKIVKQKLPNCCESAGKNVFIPHLPKSHLKANLPSLSTLPMKHKH